MDRTTVRLVLLGIGLVVIALVYLWPRIKALFDRPARFGSGAFDPEIDFSPDPPESAEEDVGVRPSGHGARSGMPDVVQISVVAPEDTAFSGARLCALFDQLGLAYGEMGIFHARADDTGATLFSVASLVEPGVFPSEGLEDREFPGVVLFLIPARSANPLQAFDVMLAAARTLAEQLGGLQWDAQRRPLDPETIASLRQSLR